MKSNFPNLIQIVPGQGNLGERALRAAQLGPFRLAHGSTKALTVAAGKPFKVASSPGSADQAMYVGVALQSGESDVDVLFSNSNGNLGPSSGVPAKMTGAVGALGGVSFSAVLLPGDDLYVQCESDVKLISFSVGF